MKKLFYPLPEVIRDTINAVFTAIVLVALGLSLDALNPIASAQDMVDVNESGVANLISYSDAGVEMRYNIMGGEADSTGECIINHNRFPVTITCYYASYYNGIMCTPIQFIKHLQPNQMLLFDVNQFHRLKIESDGKDIGFINPVFMSVTKKPTVADYIER